MAAAQEYYVSVPLRGRHVDCHIFEKFSLYVLLKKSYFLVSFIKKNRELYENLIILAGFSRDSAKNYGREIPKIGKDAAWWDLHLCG